MERGAADDDGERPIDEDDPLSRALRASLRAEAPVVPDPAFGWARVSRDIERDASGPRRRAPRMWQAAAAALFLVALAQGAWIATSGSDRFDLASDDGGAAVGASLQVAFSPDATEAEMRALLGRLGAQVVAGPSALGLYGVAVADPAAARDALAAAPIVESVSLP